ncbi:MAG: hypothetical protein K2X95_09305 [Flavobacteriaceae bacterium]|nr:hypothetical protein [Flavobacteriaceae bacterium]
MKKITLIALLFCTFTIVFAQAPQKMSYQSVIRKTDGSLVINTSVRIKISILQGSASGTALYVETQTTTTNANGLATLAIGGGTPVTGTFAGINWASGTYFIKTETDPTGGTNYTITGTSQLLSVPYALYAGSSQGKTSIVLTGNITNAQATAKIAAEYGPYTENIYIRNTTGLTTVDLSTITSLINLSISDNANLSTINLNGLTTIYEYCNINDNKALSFLSFPVLNVIPQSNGEFSIYENPVLTSISFPMLVNVSNEFSIKFNLSLTSIGLPLLSSCRSISLEGNALPSTQINTILNKLLTVTPATGKYITLNSQTPPAPPTGQGIIDKQTLINAGNNVYTD